MLYYLDYALQNKQKLLKYQMHAQLFLYTLLGQSLFPQYLFICIPISKIFFFLLYGLKPQQPTKFHLPLNKEENINSKIFIIFYFFCQSIFISSLFIFPEAVIILKLLLNLPKVHQHILYLSSIY